MGEREGKWEKFGRRGKSAYRWYLRNRRRRGAGLAGLGLLGVFTGYFLLEGVTSVVTCLVCAAALVGGAMVQRADTARAARGTTRATKADRLRYAAAGSKPYTREPDHGPTKVRVTSHNRDGSDVHTHYRNRPGQAA